MNKYINNYKIIIEKKKKKKKKKKGTRVHIIVSDGLQYTFAYNDFN